MNAEYNHPVSIFCVYYNLVRKKWMIMFNLAYLACLLNFRSKLQRYRISNPPLYFNLQVHYNEMHLQYYFIFMRVACVCQYKFIWLINS